MSEPAYTPKLEYQCKPESTHYQGCQCHEARRDAEIKRLTDEFYQREHQASLIVESKERIAVLERALDRAVEALEFVDELCLCRRFKTKGFDYGETHEKVGKAGVGERYITPKDKVFFALAEIERLRGGG